MSVASCSQAHSIAGFDWTVWHLESIRHHRGHLVRSLTQTKQSLMSSHSWTAKTGSSPAGDEQIHAYVGEMLAKGMLNPSADHNDFEPLCRARLRCSRTSSPCLADSRLCSSSSTNAVRLVFARWSQDGRSRSICRSWRPQVDHKSPIVAKLTITEQLSREFFHLSSPRLLAALPSLATDSQTRSTPIRSYPTRKSS